jgi:predicted RecA/RadA family phage recombinase
MNNYVQPGEVLTLSVPAGGVTVNKGVLIGTTFVVATETVAAATGAVFTGVSMGVIAIDKLSTEVWAEGDKIYWDNGNTRATNAPTAGLRLIGYAVAAAANPSSSGKVRLGEMPAVLSASSAPAPASYATAGAQTYTAADILGGIIVRDPNGASRTDVLPTAALLVAALPGVRVGDIIDCLIVNGADAAETITLSAGSGGAFDANQTAASRVIGQNSQKSVVIRFTNVTASSEAYVVYS